MVTLKSVPRAKRGSAARRAGWAARPAATPPRLYAPDWAPTSARLPSCSAFSTRLTPANQSTGSPPKRPATALTEAGSEITHLRGRGLSPSAPGRPAGGAPVEEVRQGEDQEEPGWEEGGCQLLGRAQGEHHGHCPQRLQLERLHLA